MKYPNGHQIAIGDHVLADGMVGVVVCDFDNRRFLDGYGEWDSPEPEMANGGTLSSGVMVNTAEAGMVHYPEGTLGITFLHR